MCFGVPLRTSGPCTTKAHANHPEIPARDKYRKNPRLRPNEIKGRSNNGWKIEGRILSDPSQVIQLSPLRDNPRFDNTRLNPCVSALLVDFAPRRGQARLGKQSYIIHQRHDCPSGPTTLRFDNDPQFSHRGIVPILAIERKIMDSRTA